MKVAFVDRDGTIIKDYEDEKWKSVIEPEFLDGALEALKEIRNKGYEIIIITNQYLINDGIISLSQYEEFTNKLIRELNKNNIDILDIFFCPHSKRENCNCFKPKIGLIKMALNKYSKIDLNSCFVVGDALCDVELGSRLGIKTFGINVKSKSLNYYQVQSLLEVLKYL